MTTTMNGSMDFEIAEPAQQPGAELAPQACSSCRKQKRRCDKQLPACSLCQRIGRPWYVIYLVVILYLRYLLMAYPTPNSDYSGETQAQAPSPEEFAALRQQVFDLQALLKSGPLRNSNESPLGLTESNGSSSNGGVQLGNNGTPSQTLSDGAPTPLWPQPSSFPSLFFLDSNAFTYERFQIQAPYVRVPPGALTALGSSGELREMIEHYFATVHTYFPIVSKIRLYQHLANPLHEPGADIALLFLSMKLMSEEIPEGMPPQTQLYQDVKSFYHYVEAQNGFSVQMIQALLLIGLYEIGNAIYPAAYLTIGNGARLSYATGLHSRTAPQILPRCNTWTEQEERRRLWWGVVILDRFVHIGNRTKPFASSDPGLETHLPTDDASWDRGQMLVAAPLSLSASQTIQVSPYARTCQAAHMLGKVLRHIDDAQLPMDYRFTEALQLHRTTRALADVLPNEVSEEDKSLKPSLCTSMAMTYSSLLTLYDAYSCSEGRDDLGGEAQLMMQKESIEGLSEFSGRAVQLAEKIREVVTNGGMDRLSPLVIDCIYQAAANCKWDISADVYNFSLHLWLLVVHIVCFDGANKRVGADAWYVRESSDSTCGERLLELKELLRMLDQRWKVAGQCVLFILLLLRRLSIGVDCVLGEYFRIIEATEFHLSSTIP